jgi:hypothetical protein
MRILRVLQSQLLRCGCFVGLYETYDGQTVAIVEEPGPGCRDSRHQAGQAIQPSDAVHGEPAELAAPRH